MFSHINSLLIYLFDDCQALVNRILFVFPEMIQNGGCEFHSVDIIKEYSGK